MRTVFWWVGCTLFIANAHAQNRAPEPAHKTTVLTGCLETGASPSLFKLTNASHSGGGQAAQTPQSQSAAQGKLEFELTLAGAPLEVDEQKVDLKSHVGHWVEINARPTVPSSPVASQPGAATTANPPTEHKPNERVTVVAIKHLAETCR